MKTNNKGFSLVELIVVIAIMAILAAVAIPTFASFIDKANIASDVSFVNDIEYAAQLAHTASGDDVTDVQITLNADGTIATASYKVDDVTVTIAKAEGATKYTATAKNTDNSANTTVAEAAADTVNAIDWTYKFKKYDNKNAWELSADGKTLEEVTAQG